MFGTLITERTSVHSNQTNEYKISKSNARYQNHKKLALNMRLQDLREK